MHSTLVSLWVLPSSKEIDILRLPLISKFKFQSRVAESLFLSIWINWTLGESFLFFLLRPSARAFIQTFHSYLLACFKSRHTWLNKGAVRSDSAQSSTFIKIQSSAYCNISYSTSLRFRIASIIILSITTIYCDHQKLYKVSKVIHRHHSTRFVALNLSDSSYVSRDLCCSNYLDY